MSGVDFTFTDALVVLIILLSAVFAYFRGFVRETLSIGAWIGAAFAALYGFRHARPIARQLISVDMIADAAAVLVVFIVALLVFSLISGFISRRIQGSALSAVDRSLGFAFGIARGVVVVCLILLAINWAVPREQRPDWLVRARTLPAIEMGAQWLLNLLPRDAKSETRSAADETRRKAEQAIDLKRSYDRLVSPQPQPANPDAAQDRQGYNADQRREFDRLIRSTN